MRLWSVRREFDSLLPPLGKKVKMKTKKILFVCKYNRFRSRVAESFFKKYNKNKGINSDSAGVFRGELPLGKNEIEVAKEFGIKIKGKPKGMSYPKLFGYDIVVIVANDVPRNLFRREGKYNNKVIEWKINDNYDGDKVKLRKIVDKIENKVIKLVKKLEKEK